MQTTEEEHIWFSKRLLFTLSVNFGVWAGCFNFLDFFSQDKSTKGSHLHCRQFSFDLQRLGHAGTALDNDILIS